METGDAAAAVLVRQAGEEANLALRELRDLARGIHPAILTNRGLPAALEDLAARATVPVEVVDTPDARLPDPVEAAAYFVVSECLANIGKHADATNAWITVAHEDGVLRAVVGDDGGGGADPAAGTGMLGVMRRLAAFDGTMSVSSPPGGPTLVTLEVPCGLSSQKTTPSSGPA
jgi:signal transduction histidine kinase